MMREENNRWIMDVGCQMSDIGSENHQTQKESSAFANSRKSEIRNPKYRWSLIAACLILAACSTTKHIPADDALYTGATVKLNAENVSTQQKKVLHADLEGMTRPRPNGRFLGIPFK